MKLLPNNSNLPSKFAALRFVCGCFGIGEKDLAQTLERMRKATKNPNEYLPQKLSRMMLMRAENGKGQWKDVLCNLHHEALYGRIYGDEGKPLFSITGKVADEIIASLLTLYERLLPRLDFRGVSKPEAMWLLVEHVFVPTVFIKLGAEWQYGLGTELQGKTCWYLPIKSDGCTVKPIARVLDCWLRVAGFRTAYGLSKTLSKRKADDATSEEETQLHWDKWKKNVGRWLNGECVPSVETLHELGDVFAERVTWLDQSAPWNARLTLACAMQRLGDAMDKFFSGVRNDSSLQLVDLLRQISDERLVCDDDKLLSDLLLFFAVRLFQLRLKKEGEWEKIVASARKPTSLLFPQSATDEEISTCRKQIHREMNPGNWFLEFIKKEANLSGRLNSKDSSVESSTALEAYIFEVGVCELNRLLNSKRKWAGER